jgi:hypothetical protein
MHIARITVQANISQADTVYARLGPYNAGILSRCFAGIGNANRFSTIAYRTVLPASFPRRYFAGPHSWRFLCALDVCRLDLS